jgi:hypothetical protein
LGNWLELDAGTVVLHVDTRGARYPLVVDPFIQQGSKLTAEDGVGDGQLGSSVALSSDGNTALIGGFEDAAGEGAAWVFKRTGSTWIQEGPKLTAPSDLSGPKWFGWSVALTSDGNTALIGAPRIENGAGAAWIFTRSGSIWTQGPELRGTTEENCSGSFGSSVGLSADGSIAMVGGGGAVCAFTRSGATWRQQGPKLVDGQTHTGSFGSSLSLSSDGNTILIGGLAPNESMAPSVFVRSGSTWSEQAVLRNPNEFDSGRYGLSVALSGDGNTALVGEPPDIPFQYIPFAGEAWVFTRSGSTWTPQGPALTSPQTGETAFASSVALSADGDTALIGSGQDGGGKGAAWAFRRSGGTWAKQAPILVGGEEENGLGAFGSSVVLSSDATTALIGSPADRPHFDEAPGAAWMFAEAPPGAATAGASNVGEDTATLNATVDPRGLASDAYFEYGTTTSYGQTTHPQDAGTMDGAIPVSADIVGLAPATTYHFRILAESVGGVSHGADQTFTTAPSIPPSPIPLAPVNVVAPAISGAPVRGQALSVSQGSWANNPTFFGYRWQSCDTVTHSCRAIADAVGPTHNLTQADVGRILRATVTGENVAGSSAASSVFSPIVGSQIESTMTWVFDWSPRYTIVKSLVIHAMPSGATVGVTCHGHGCAFRHTRASLTKRSARCSHPWCKRRNSPPRQDGLDLAPLFKGNSLVVGTTISVSIVKSGWVGKAFKFTVRLNRPPSVRVGCLPVGSNDIGGEC